MIIGQRKNRSQDDIERATQLVRPYISRVENGHTVTGIETLEKWAQALGMPLYQVLYEGEEPPKPPKPPNKAKNCGEILDGRRDNWTDSDAFSRK